jgi:putative Mg2+ transporter-C (MgtC) family protein
MRRDASPLPARLACLALFARLACALGEAHAVSDSGSGASETAPDGGGSACGAYRGAACDAVLMSSVLTESTGAFAVKCLVAVALGAVIGAQREFSPYLGMFLVRARRTAVAPVRRAGLRTHVLVALGSCLFTDASWSAFAVPVPARVKGAPFVAGTFNYDTARVAAQVVSGVGFLGAGTIWRSSFGSSDSDSKGSRDEVYGLTTAASLWTTAAVGMHCGGVNQKDAYFAGPAFATALVVITLQALVHFELAAHAAAFARTTTRVSARVTVEVDERLERLEQGEEPSDEARLDISDAREASSVRRDPSGRVRPGGVLRDVVAAVERRGTSRVASVGASVDISNPRFPIEHRAGFSSETACSVLSVRVSLVVVVPACGGSADLLDALVACEGVTEARVDACGPRRDEAKTKKTKKLEKRRSEERPEPRAAENMEDMEDIEDVEDEPNAPLLFPRRRARASS